MLRLIILILFAASLAFAEAPADNDTQESISLEEEVPAEVETLSTAPKSEAPTAPPALPPGGESLEELAEPTTSPLESKELEQLAINARFDSAYVTGNGLVQGFSLASSILTFRGDLTPTLEYQFSIAQTREYSTVSLPQLFPIDAYARIHSRPVGVIKENFELRVGMFRPHFHPLWTPDLGELNVPTKHITHREVFLDNELGMQALYQSKKEDFQGGLGFFNGSGILSENTNNAKTLTAFWEYALEVQPGMYLKAGASALGRLQSVRGNLNFRQDWLLMGWAAIELPTVYMLADYFIGEFEDSTFSRSPNGASFLLDLRLQPELSFWGRYETMFGAPSGGAGRLYRWQVGPSVQLNRYLNIFATYGQFEDGNGNGIEKEFRVQLRLKV